MRAAAERRIDETGREQQGPDIRGQKWPNKDFTFGTKQREQANQLKPDRKLKSKLRIREVQVQLSPTMPLAGNVEEALETAAISAAIDIRLHPLLDKETAVQPTIQTTNPDHTESALVADAVRVTDKGVEEPSSDCNVEQAERSILSRLSRPEELSDMAGLIMSSKTQGLGSSPAARDCD